MARDDGAPTYLLIDVGHVLTHAAYVASVEGASRLVAVAEAGTTKAGGGGLLDGVRRAVGNLEDLLGRKVLDQAGNLRRPSDGEGHGVDEVVLTTSLVPALRVALVGLTRDLSLASAARAATLPYVTVVRSVCLESSARRWETDDLQSLLEDPPDVLVLVGGVDGGPVAPIRDVAEALSAAYSVLPESARPAVIFAGNERAQRPLIAAFSSVTELRLVANVRPAPTKENLGELRASLARVFYRQQLGGPEELRELAEWGDARLMYDLDAVARTLRFEARRYGLGKGVLGVDVGGSGCRALLVAPEGPALTWAAPYGTGEGAASLRKLADSGAVLRWLHHPLNWAEVWDRLGNVEVRPGGVPQSDEDWDLQQAAAREALHQTWAGALDAWSGYPGYEDLTGALEVVIARGTALNHARTPGRAALLLVDALQPVGLVRLALDWANLLPGLAGLAQLDPLAALQVLDNDGLMELGTVVALAGRLAPGREALKVRLAVQGELRAELAVPAGSIRRLPLGVNELGRLELYPAKGLDVGMGRPGQGGVAEVRGGALGIIIDARGRPLSIPGDEAERCGVLQTWQREIDDG